MSAEEKVLYLDESIGYISVDGKFDISTWMYPTLNAAIKVLTELKPKMVKMHQRENVYPILLTYSYNKLAKSRKADFISLMYQFVDYMEEHRSHPYIDLGFIPLPKGVYEDPIDIDIDTRKSDTRKGNKDFGNPISMVIELRNMKSKIFDDDRILLNNWKSESTTFLNFLRSIIGLPRSSSLRYAIYDIMVVGQWGLIDVAVTMFTKWGYYSDYLPISTYSSKRPKTTMPFIGVPEPIDRQLVPLDNIITVDDEGNHYCPVVRYGSGMNGTYYLSKSQHRFCGTFYYLEPESEYLLRFGSYKVYRNKYSAFLDLITIPEALDNWAKNDPIQYNRFKVDKPYLENFTSSFAHDFIESSIQSLVDRSAYGKMNDIRRGYREYIKDGKPLKTKFGIDIDPETNIGPNEKGEMVYHTWLYGAEDDYDQPICNLARGLGLEVIILTTMAGKTRVVTEVLDTRSRDVSYKNILLDTVDEE